MKKLIIFFLLSSLYIPLQGQGLSLDPSFLPGSGFNNQVRRLAIQTDGKILVGGAFSAYNGDTRLRIARLNSDGSLDASFGTPSNGTNNTVEAISIQPDGKILIGGFFNTLNSNSQNRIARLESDGSLDPSFMPGAAFNGTVSAIAIQTDGKILAGGEFTNFASTNLNRIARLNADGTLDNTFNPGLGFSAAFVANVRAIAVQNDGRILVGGAFTDFNGQIRNNIVRLNTDGSLDNTFSIGSGFSGPVLSLSLQSDGRIIASGNFTTYNGISRNNIARLNSNGSLDATFNPGTGGNNEIWTTALQADGKVLAGGLFTSFNGIARNRIVRLNTNGSVDTDFNPYAGFNNLVSHLVIQADGSVVTGGTFSSYNGQARNTIARLSNCQFSSATLTDTACISYTLNGQTYTSSGTYNQTLVNVAGCDSSLTLNLTILQPSTASLTQTACSSFTLNSTTYSSSGTYTQILPNAVGCDSTITLNLTINQPTSATLTQSACSSFTLNGTTYTSSGAYTQTLSNAAGCDSTITLNLTINAPSTASLSDTACGSYMLNGQTYTNSGTYSQTLSNAAGCDSLLTLDLVIKAPSSSSLTETACSSYMLNGQTYTSSGTYTQTLTNAVGCDSILSLNLTINQPSSSSLTETACSSYSLNGQTYTNSGTYTQTLTNAVGCDSVLSLNLTINQPSSSSLTETACSSYSLNGQTYTSSGTYTQVLSNAAGCDSTISLSLTVNPQPDTTVNQEGDTLVAQLTGATYQWIDCNTGSPIAGADAASFSPSISGDYALVVTLNGCSDTSACRNVLLITSLTSEQGGAAYRLYPNPSQGRFYLETAMQTEQLQVELFDVLGRRQWTYSLAPQALHELQLPEQAGAYILRLQDQKGQVRTWKLIKSL